MKILLQSKRQTDVTHAGSKGFRSTCCYIRLPIRLPTTRSTLVCILSTNLSMRPANPIPTHRGDDYRNSVLGATPCQLSMWWQCRTWKKRRICFPYHLNVKQACRNWHAHPSTQPQHPLLCQIRKWSYWCCLGAFSTPAPWESVEGRCVAIIAECRIADVQRLWEPFSPVGWTNHEYVLRWVSYINLDSRSTHFDPYNKSSFA